MVRAKAQGKHVGRPKSMPVEVHPKFRWAADQVRRGLLSQADAARVLGVQRVRLSRALGLDRGPRQQSQGESGTSRR